MSRIQTDFNTKKPTSVRVVTQPAVVRQPTAALFECLIASPSVSRAAILEEAAIDQGWQPIVCNDVEEALRTAVCRRIRLAAVDLEASSASGLNRFREVIEQVSCEDGPLVLVCGSDGDVEEEIWARQLGAWMYLPGVDMGSDIPMLFGEAINVVKKLHTMAPAGEPAGRGVPTAGRPR